MSTDEPVVHRPQPQRLWTLSPPDSEPTSPANELSEYSPSSPASHSPNPFSASRTRSVLNLTASTLAGIYAPDDDSSLFGVTPLGTGGATTPNHSFFSPTSPSPRLSSVSGPSITEADRERDRMAPVIGALERPEFRQTPSAVIRGRSKPLYTRVFRGIVRAALLFGLGAAYGSLVTHLHDARHLAPVKIDGLNRYRVSYTLFWGIAGILLGTALPIVDAIWEGEGPEDKRRAAQYNQGQGRKTTGANDAAGNPLTEAVGLGAEWNPMVRSIGAFVGIGFAIRRLPWQSTLQASATLCMVNPCLWYMIDRTFPGFALASLVGILGTSVLLGTNVVPMPDVRGTSAVGGGSNGSAMGMQSGAIGADGLVLGVEQGRLAVWVWIASVLFCSTVCFGNIGRRLALGISGR